MEEKEYYPVLDIDLGKLKSNATQVISRCNEKGIAVAGVIKGFSGLPQMARAMYEAGTSQIASSRLRHLREVKEAGIPGPYLLLRIPMLSELDEVVALTDYSLQSDLKTLDALQLECAAQRKRHKVVMMVDLGDLREGFWDKEEAVAACVYVEKNLPMVELAGIGTNLGCYGAIQPTPEKMHELLLVAKSVESEIGRALEIISGGGRPVRTLWCIGEQCPRESTIFESARE